MTDTLKQVGSTAVFTAPMRSVGGFENKQKYLKSTYVPPHQRNKSNNSVKNFEKFNGGKKTQTDYSQSYKPRGLTLTFCFCFRVRMTRRYQISNLKWGLKPLRVAEKQQNIFMASKQF